MNLPKRPIGTAAAINNTGTGVITVESLTEEIVMQCVEFYSDTEDGVGAEFVVTGDFDIQVTSVGKGKFILYKAIGSGEDSGVSSEVFSTYREYNGPRHDTIRNSGTSRFKAELTGSQGLDVKKLLASIPES